MNTSPLVEVKNITRAFGSVQALKGVSFSLQRGQVVGLIGANGAGKTTAMRILASLDMPDSGRVLIGGVDIVQEPNVVRRSMGWMPDHFQAYRDMTVGDYIDFFGRAHGFRGEELTRRVTEVMEFTELTPLRERPMDKLSKGQTQRLCLGRTLLNDPDFLLLDEPAAGLDPQARLEFKNLVRILRERGKTLLISSHILTELGEMCDTLLFMDQGRVVHHGEKEDLLRQDAAAGPVFDLLVHGPVAALSEWLEMRPGWKLVELRRDGARAEFHRGEPEAVAAEVRRLAADLPLLGFQRQERRLEEAFVDILRTGAGPIRRNAAAGGETPPPLPTDLSSGKEGRA
jgi:ABC-2 type transport system ATP-binding protein